jgi:hypothetical protein
MSPSSLQRKASRAGIFVAVIWAIFLIVFISATYPRPVVASLEAWWSYERVELTRKSGEEGISHRDIRIGLFGDKSNAEIIRPAGFDIATSIPVDSYAPEFASANARRSAVIALDLKFNSLINTVRAHMLVVTVALTTLLWFIPVFTVALARQAVEWFHRGTWV